MEQEIEVSIILEGPTSGVTFGLQKGSGKNYQTIQKQTGDGGNLTFTCKLRVKQADINPPVFLGAFAQGTAADRFIYIDIGSYAGQITHWSRRLKIPLKGITTEMIREVLADPTVTLITTVAGRGKDGGPNCGTVKPFTGWTVKKSGT